MKGSRNGEFNSAPQGSTLLTPARNDAAVMSATVACARPDSGYGADQAARSVTYALITPARNEAVFIEQVIKAVVEQTVLPVKWVIVSDGSTDGTDDIVRAYAAKYDWIELVRLPEHRDRHFAAKVMAFSAGYAKLAGTSYDVIGNLDADITFDGNYFEFLMKKFAENERLGVAGTPFREGDVQYDYRYTSVEHVSGACQLFRRQCYEEIGGYTPIKIGGIDLVAVISARMNGWQTRTFVEMTCFHHRKMGTANKIALMVAYKGGRGDYMLGGHPLWELLRCIYQMKGRPFVLAGSFRLAGFMWAMFTGVEKVVPGEFIRFRRAEQMSRLRDFTRRVLRLQVSTSGTA